MIAGLNPAIFCALALALLSPMQARAQELSGSFVVYGWLPWIDSTITRRSTGGTFTTKTDPSSVIENLNFAFMGAGEIHYDRFGLLFDLVYSDLSADGTTSGPLSSEVGLDINMLLVTAALGYQAYREDGRLIEPYAGFRYGKIKTDVTATGGGPIGISRSASAKIDWWDPILGVRGRYPLTEDLSAGGFVDVGGFGVGTEFSWQVYAGLEYSFTDRISTNLGFRYLSIDYEGRVADTNMDQYGPVIGLRVNF